MKTLTRWGLVLSLIALAVGSWSCVSRPVRTGQLGGGYPLCQNGATPYVIVSASDATAPETFAAHRLADYLRRITGVTFPIVTEDQAPRGARIIVGPGKLSRAALRQAEWASLGTDDFIIRSRGSDLLLVGGRPRGTIYAVDSFLEQELGCRWLDMYGNELVPARPTIELGRVNRRESPAFQNRSIWFLFYGQDLNQPRNFLIGNRFFGRFLDDGVGGEPYVCQQPGVHTLFHYLDPGSSNKNVIAAHVFQKHPEFFSLIDGQRVATRQLCFSNPELRQKLTENILGHMRQMDGQGVFNVSAMDVPGDFCQCPECRALVQREGTPGAPLLNYLVELAKQVRETYPQARLSTLAYRKGQTEKPPATLVMPDNLIVIFAPIDRNFAAALTHPSNADTLANLQAWAAQTKNLWIWYYSNPYEVLPIGNLTNTAEDFRLFKQLGGTGLFIEHDAGIPESYLLADLQTWLLAKLMWDPAQDLTALIRDFTQRYYGAAGQYLRQYIDQLELATRAMKTTMTWAPAPSQYRFLTPAFLKTATDIFDQAEAAVAGDAVTLLRVRQVRMSLDRATLVFWNEPGSDRRGGVTKTELARRYTETYTQTVQQRMPPGVQASQIKSLENFLKPRLLMTPVKPLPALLAGIPADRVRQILPDMASSCGDAKIETDSRAAAFICVAKATEGELPLTYGYYDETRKAFVISGKIEKRDITTAGYQLYKLGRVALNEHCAVWITKSWFVSFALGAFYDGLHPAQQWDLYVSLRFEGPAYLAGAAGQTDRVCVDRVILVRAE